MAKAADVYFSVNPWKVTETGFDPAYSRVSESVFSLANESMGVRGSFDEGGSVDSLRGAYVNGVYDEVPLAKSYRGIIDRTHFMVPAADWLLTEMELDGEKLDLGKVCFRDFRRELDLRTGILSRSLIWRTRSGKEIRLRFERFMDMVRRERAWQRITLEALNFSGSIRVTSGLSFETVHEGTGTCYWQAVRSEAEGQRLAVQARTKGSGQEVFAGARIDLQGRTEAAAADKTARISAEVPLKQGEPARIEKRVVILFNGDGGDTLWQAGLQALAEAEQDGTTVSLYIEADGSLRRYDNGWSRWEEAEEADTDNLPTGISEAWREAIDLRIIEPFVRSFNPKAMADCLRDVNVNYDHKIFFTGYHGTFEKEGQQFLWFYTDAYRDRSVRMKFVVQTAPVMRIVYFDAELEATAEGGNG